MKVHFILFWLCAGFTACAHQAHIDSPNIANDNPVNTDTVPPFITERKNRPEHQEAIKAETTDCYSRNIDLSDGPCNIVAWQSFFTALLLSSNAHRQLQLANLATTDVDHLKRLLLLTHHDEELAIRAHSVRELERTLSRYNLPLQDFLYIAITLNKQLLTQEQRTRISTETANELQNELNTTKKLLDQAQKKIDAITNIEQQLNAEGSLINEDNSGP